MAETAEASKKGVNPNEQVKFLISCIKNTDAGKVSGGAPTIFAALTMARLIGMQFPRNVRSSLAPLRKCPLHSILYSSTNEFQLTEIFPKCKTLRAPTQSTRRKRKGTPVPAGRIKSQRRGWRREARQKEPGQETCF